MEIPIGLDQIVGAQVLIGGLFVFASFYFGRMAFSENLAWIARDGAFAGYLIASLSLFTVGSFLLVSIGLTVHLLGGAIGQ